MYLKNILYHFLTEEDIISILLILKMHHLGKITERNLQGVQIYNFFSKWKKHWTLKQL